MSPCAYCGVTGQPMKPVGMVKMCIDNVGCKARKEADSSDAHVELTVICDRCGAALTVEATSREAARAALRARADEARWRFIDRLEGALDTAAQLTGHASSTTIGVPDLCGDCA